MTLFSLHRAILTFALNVPRLGDQGPCIKTTRWSFVLAGPLT